KILNVPGRVRLRFPLPCGLVGCLFEQPAYPSQSNLHLHHLSREWGWGCLRLRASNEGLLRPRVAQARKAPQPHPNLFFNNSFTFPGFAFPPLAFITCPTRNPSTCCLPSLN